MIKPENRYLASFCDYLFEQGLIPDKLVKHYVEWVRKAYLHAGKGHEISLSLEEKNSFLGRVKLDAPGWMVKQARQAPHYIATYGARKNN